MADVGSPEDDVEEEDEIPESRPRIIKTGAPPWIVTFADLTTLMLTFFVLLLSFANMDVVEYRQMMGSMNESFGATFEEHGKFMATAQSGSMADKMGVLKVGSPESKFRHNQNRISDIVADSAIKSGIRDNVKVFYSDDGVTVQLSDTAAFSSGRARLKKKILPFLKGIAPIVKSFNFNLLVEGHTDSIPIRTKRFPSNWELSTVRATTVLRKLIKYGVPEDRIAAVGYADRKPLRNNKTAENRAINRRVEFKFIKPEEE